MVKRINQLVVGGFLVAGLVSMNYGGQYLTPYTSDVAYAGKFLDITRERFKKMKEKIQEYDRSGKSREHAKKAAGAILEHVYGVPGGGKIIDKIDKESFNKDGSIKRKK